jgi:hypothetical protein
MKTRFASRKKLLLLAAIAAVFLVTVFGQNLIFASAVASSESRPALLREADWGVPAPSFQKRFIAGTSEAELLRWLSENGFELNGAHSASRRISGLPCNEMVEVSWSASNGVIRESSAVVNEAGCL